MSPKGTESSHLPEYCRNIFPITSNIASSHKASAHPTGSPSLCGRQSFVCCRNPPQAWQQLMPNYFPAVYNLSCPTAVMKAARSRRSRWAKKVAWLPPPPRLETLRAQFRHLHDKKTAAINYVTCAPFLGADSSHRRRQRYLRSRNSETDLEPKTA